MKSILFICLLVLCIFAKRHRQEDEVECATNKCGDLFKKMSVDSITALFKCDDKYGGSDLNKYKQCIAKIPGGPALSDCFYDNCVFKKEVPTIASLLKKMN